MAMPSLNLVYEAFATGSSEIVAAVPGKRITVHNVSLMRDVGLPTAQFFSAATALTPAGIYGSVFVPWLLPYSEYGWFWTAVNEALNITVSVAGPTEMFVHLAWSLKDSLS